MIPRVTRKLKINEKIKIYIPIGNERNIDLQEGCEYFNTRSLTLCCDENLENSLIPEELYE